MWFRVCLGVIGALLLSLPGRVQAQTVYADQGAAYAGCKTNAEAHRTKYGQTSVTEDCVYSETVTNGQYYCRGRVSATMVGCDNKSSNHLFPKAQKCTQRPNEPTWMDPTGTGKVCSNGCAYIFTIDGGSHYFAPTGAVCTTTDTPEPEIDTDGDGVPDDEDAFPNDPNESKDTDGDGIGDNADVAPEDPTNGDDSGEGDEKDNSAQGGGDCKAPPSCSGDGIQCNQLYQQWAMRCKGATVTGDPTNCTAAYTCSGDSVQCAMVALSRKTACAVGSGSEPGGGEGGGGDGNGNGVADVLEGSVSGGGLDGGENDVVTRWGIGVSTNMLDQENIFGGGSCPQFPSFSIMGVTIDGDSIPYWCTLVMVMRVGILLMGAYLAIQILLGGL